MHTAREGAPPRDDHADAPAEIMAALSTSPSARHIPAQRRALWKLHVSGMDDWVRISGADEQVVMDAGAAKLAQTIGSAWAKGPGRPIK